MRERYVAENESLSARSVVAQEAKERLEAREQEFRRRSQELENAYEKKLADCARELHESEQQNRSLSSQNAMFREKVQALQKEINQLDEVQKQAVKEVKEREEIRKRD